MTVEALQVEAIEFFDAFVEAFGSFSGSRIARRYLVPYLALHRDGTTSLLLTDDDVARYFQSIVDRYNSRGCRSCRYKELEIVPIGGRCALGTVTWELLRQNGTVLSAWRESYNLVRPANIRLDPVRATGGAGMP